MKYTIRTNEAGHILAVNRWKPIIIKGGEKENIEYNIPPDAEEITKEKFESLMKRRDLNRITWLDGNVIEEKQSDKEARENNQAISSRNREDNEIKGLLIKLQGYIVLSEKGESLLKK